MDTDTTNRINPPFEFDEEMLTSRKREILAWLKIKQIELRSLGSNPRSMKSLRVYIPIELSRANMEPFLVLKPSLSDPLLELFDYKYELEYVDSYPWVDKYRLIPIKPSSDGKP